MKEWIKRSLKIAHLLASGFIVVFSIIGNFLEISNIMKISLICIFTFILIFISIAQLFLPNYSLNKYLRKLYDFKYIGKYEGQLFFNTFNHDTKEIMNNKKEGKKVKFEIKFKNNLIVKEQETSSTISKANLISFYKNNAEIILLFKYFHEAEYIKDKKEKWWGYEIIKMDSKKNEIIENKYFNDKPGYGEIKNIIKIK